VECRPQKDEATSGAADWEDVAPDGAGNSWRWVSTKMARLRRCGILLGFLQKAKTNFRLAGHHLQAGQMAGEQMPFVEHHQIAPARRQKPNSERQLELEHRLAADTFWS
jgi:hypothetical protein